MTHEMQPPERTPELTVPGSPAAPPGPGEGAQLDEKRARRTYTRLRRRTAAWLGRHRVPGPLRDYMLLLPDLFMLLIRLIRDPRVDRGLRRRLILAAVYVMSPIDLALDLFLPIGLADDTVAIAFILTNVIAMMGTTGEQVLREHWDGPGDILQQIARITGAANRVLSNRVVGWLRKRFLGA